MSGFARIGWRRGGLGLALAAVLMLMAIRLCTHVQAGEPEIALLIGEPYEAMRQRSSAAIDPAIPNETWYNVPHTDARLRFIDKQYGFVTPPASFFTVGYSKGVVDSVRMSPQIEPLLLDDTLKIVLNLQDQLRKGGWVSIGAKEDPPFADTPEWRAQLRNVDKGGTAYWQAGEKYQVMLDVGRFKDVRHPTEERYLISLDLAKPWVDSR